MPWLRRTLGVLIALLIGIGIAVPAVSILAPMFGRQAIAIRGGSMEPAIPLGALIVISGRQVEDLGAGDVVTWRTESGVLVTHRVQQIVVENGELFVQTKGDANATPDPAAVPASAIIGAVDAWVPLLGFASIMLGTPTGVLSWISFGLALLVTDTLVAGLGTQRSGPQSATRRSAAGAPSASGWPIHFVGVTVDGFDLSLLDDMSRCADGDHSRCPTSAIIARRAAALALDWPAGAR